MATLTLTYETGSVTLTDLNNMLALEWGYQETINGQPNPESKANFNRRQVRRMIQEAYLRQRRIQAEVAATNGLPSVPDFE